MTAGTVVAGAALCAAMAAAPAGPALDVTIDDCAGVPSERVLAVLAVELRTAQPGAGAEGRATAVSVTCSEAGVELRVADPLTQKTLSRTVRLSAAAPVVRPRLLALAIVELVSASWAELSWNPEPTGVAAPAAGEREAALDTVAPRAAPPARRALRLMAAFGGRGFLQSPRWTWGGGARVSHDWEWLRWSMDALYERGSSAAPGFGSVTADAFSAGVALLAHRQLGPVSVGAGPGLRAGVARFGGVPESDLVQGAAVTGGWAGAQLTAAARLDVGWLAIELGVEAGLVFLPVVARAGGVRVAAAEGAWLAALLSAGVSL